MNISRVVGRRFLGAPTLKQVCRVGVRLNSTSVDPTARYRAKLEKKAKLEGVASIDELKIKLKEEINEKKKEFNKIDPIKLLEESENKNRIESINKTAKERGPLPPPLPKADIKDLKTFIDVDKLKLHDNKEIELIWKARFAHKEKSLCGLINGITYSLIYKNARKNPVFVLPLPHESEGIELHFVQWSFVGTNTIHCMLTTLAEYKLHQDFARPHTTLIFHSDLLAEKEIVLMNGSIEKDSSISLDEAVLLSLNLQRFYSSTAPSNKLTLLESFNNGDNQFAVEALITETEKLD